MAMERNEEKCSKTIWLHVSIASLSKHFTLIHVFLFLLTAFSFIYFILSKTWDSDIFFISLSSGLLIFLIRFLLYYKSIKSSYCNTYQSKKKKNWIGVSIYTSISLFYIIYISLRPLNPEPEELKISSILILLIILYDISHQLFLKIDSTDRNSFCFIDNNRYCCLIAVHVAQFIVLLIWGFMFQELLFLFYKQNTFFTLIWDATIHKLLKYNKELKIITGTFSWAMSLGPSVYQVAKKQKLCPEWNPFQPNDFRATYTIHSIIYILLGIVMYAITIPLQYCTFFIFSIMLVTAFVSYLLLAKPESAVVTKGINKLLIRPKILASGIIHCSKYNVLCDIKKLKKADIDQKMEALFRNYVSIVSEVTAKIYVSKDSTNLIDNLINLSKDLLYCTGRYKHNYCAIYTLGFIYGYYLHPQQSTTTQSFDTTFYDSLYNSFFLAWKNAKSEVLRDYYDIIGYGMLMKKYYITKDITALKNGKNKYTTMPNTNSKKQEQSKFYCQFHEWLTDILLHKLDPKYIYSSHIEQFDALWDWIVKINQ